MAEVSVLMTVYNGMPYLPTAVKSILDQTLQDLHFVIVNDGSTDGTKEYLASLDDDRIDVIHQENRGTAAAANHGLSLVKTPYLARMDADDVAVANRLEVQLKYLQENPDVGLVGGQVVPMGDHGEGRSLALPLRHDAIDRCLMLGQHALAHSSLMMRTNVLKSIGGYWKHRLVDDVDMMIRMGEVSKLANVSDILLKYRVHANSVNGRGQMRLHQSYQYAIKLAQLRRAGQPAITVEEFEAMQRDRNWFAQMGEKIHVHAISQYRVGIAEIHGRRRLTGAFRIVWAMCCSPSRTLHRLTRIAKKKIGAVG